jgi:hypothetical protein
MAHALVLAMFAGRDRAAEAARALHAAGVTREELSVVARDHQDEGELAGAYDATPGADLEDSRGASRLGELSAHVLAAVSLVVPGVGPALAAGPLAAEFGEAAGHVAGSLTGVLRDSGVDEARALAWQDAVESGGVLLGVHAIGTPVARIRDALRQVSPDDVAETQWE